MTFDTPTDFREAVTGFRFKQVARTRLSSEAIEALAVSVRNRAFFSARVMNAEFLTNAKGMIDRLLTPRSSKQKRTRTDPATGKGREVVIDVTEGADIAEIRLALKDYLAQTGYNPAAKDIGTIKDLSTDGRLNLILKTQSDMARGFGRHQQGQDPAILSVFPAQQLFRAEDRNVPRAWKARWTNAGGRTFGGRMVAMKGDPIWSAISRFGNPFPPFDFNSGMDIRDVTRTDALAIGLMTTETPAPTPEPEPDAFNRNMVAATSASGDMLDTLLESLGEDFERKGGKVQQKGGA